jgi:hypothetical protein
MGCLPSDIVRDMSHTQDTLKKKGGEASLHRLWMHTVAIVNSLPIFGTDPATNGPASAEELELDVPLRGETMISS